MENKEITLEELSKQFEEFKEKKEKEFEELSKTHKEEIESLKKELMQRKFDNELNKGITPKEEEIPEEEKIVTLKDLDKMEEII